VIPMLENALSRKTIGTRGLRGCTITRRLRQAGQAWRHDASNDRPLTGNIYRRWESTTLSSAFFVPDIRLEVRVLIASPVNDARSGTQHSVSNRSPRPPGKELCRRGTTIQSLEATLNGCGS